MGFHPVCDDVLTKPPEAPRHQLDGGSGLGAQCIGHLLLVYAFARHALVDFHREPLDTHTCLRLAWSGQGVLHMIPHSLLYQLRDGPVPFVPRLR